jgi:hypothetical protein
MFNQNDIDSYLQRFGYLLACIELQETAYV